MSDRKDNMGAEIFRENDPRIRHRDMCAVSSDRTAEQEETRVTKNSSPVKPAGSFDTMLAGYDHTDEEHFRV